MSAINSTDMNKEKIMGAVKVWLTPLLISALGFFLKQVYDQISSVNMKMDTYIIMQNKQEMKVDELFRRMDRLEANCDENEDAIKENYTEIAVLKGK